MVGLRLPASHMRRSPTQFAHGRLRQFRGATHRMRLPRRAVAGVRASDPGGPGAARPALLARGDIITLSQYRGTCCCQFRGLAHSC